MVFEWKNNVLLITGASKGIGASVTRQALAEGVQQVFNLDIDKENGVALQQELNDIYGDKKVTFIYCDVANEEQLKTNFKLVLADNSKNYIVVNNAGIFNDSLQTFKKEIDINLTGLVTGSLIALDLMRKDNGGNGGTIINMSSITAFNVVPCFPVYNATKSAILTFGISLGADEFYNRTDVRVITICCGMTDTSIILKENIGSFDEEMVHKMIEIMEDYPNQSGDSAGRAVIEAFKYGASASVWLSNADNPAEDITNFVTKANKIMAEPILKYKK
ncbi:unnamed protein product [Arctia plantaginis]|uniref:Alcohol dehydrogenase n=1 Tax=Arctia plantaginis TaxID=874455 RepID=A0A8S1AYF5_ARCPL|nr:unnamed protein product [Arctia plantaginis]